VEVAFWGVGGGGKQETAAHLETSTLCSRTGSPPGPPRPCPRRLTAGWRSGETWLADTSSSVSPAGPEEPRWPLWVAGRPGFRGSAVTVRTYPGVPRVYQIWKMAPGRLERTSVGRMRGLGTNERFISKTPPASVPDYRVCSCGRRWWERNLKRPQPDWPGDAQKGTRFTNLSALRPFLQSLVPAWPPQALGGNWSG
jgi:hypothetical protein